MLNITIDKVAYIAFMIRQEGQSYGGGADAYSDKSFDLESQHNIDDFEDNVERGINPELVEYIDDLNEDEAIDLVCLMWIGRGTYSVDQLAEARQVAVEEATHKTSDYLLGTPMLSDYLEAGLIEFGFTPEEIEREQF